MVKYYGRAKTRVGSVNTNQLGLKMSGCPSKIGKQGALVKYQSRRVQCNQKFCGPVYYQGQMWSWNSERCVPRAPRTQAFNSGVGHINAPRFGCGDTCATELTLDVAFDLINNYFRKFIINNPNGYIPSLVSNNIIEELNIELSEIEYLKNKNFYFDTAPHIIKTAISFVNNKGLTFKFNNKFRKHYVALVSVNDIDIYAQNKIGKYINIGKSGIYTLTDNNDACSGCCEGLLSSTTVEWSNKKPSNKQLACTTYTNLTNYVGGGNQQVFALLEPYVDQILKTPSTTFNLGISIRKIIFPSDLDFFNKREGAPHNIEYNNELNLLPNDPNPTFGKETVIVAYFTLTGELPPQDKTDISKIFECKNCPQATDGTYIGGPNILGKDIYIYYAPIATGIIPRENSFDKPYMIIGAKSYRY